MISSVALAESMGCQGGKWFLGKCGVIINKYSWAHLSVHYIDTVMILGNVLNIYSGYER